MSDKKILKYETKSVEVVEDGVIYIEETTYRVFTDETKEVACSVKYPKPSDESVEPEPTEEELIQAQILLNQADILAR